MRNSVPSQNQESMMQTFTTPAPVTAVLDIPAGRIQVTAAGQDTASVQIQPADPAKNRDVKLAAQVTAAYRDGVLTVAGPAGHRILGSTGAVAVTVRVPAGSQVEAKAASVQFTTSGPLGAVTVDSAQATVTVSEAATAFLSVTDGDITVGRLGGDGQIHTVTGDIKVGQATAGFLDLATQTGEITVGAATGVSATLDAGTTRGRIHNTMVNSGGTPALAVRATTILGDITARSM